MHRRRIPRNRMKFKDVSKFCQSHEKMLESIEVFQKHHEKVLNRILNLEEKI